MFKIVHLANYLKFKKCYKKNFNKQWYKLWYCKDNGEYWVLWTICDSVQCSVRSVTSLLPTISLYNKFLDCLLYTSTITTFTVRIELDLWFLVKFSLSSLKHFYFSYRSYFNWSAIGTVIMIVKEYFILLTDYCKILLLLIIGQSSFYLVSSKSFQLKIGANTSFKLLSFQCYISRFLAGYLTALEQPFSNQS